MKEYIKLVKIVPVLLCTLSGLIVAPMASAASLSPCTQPAPPQYCADGTVMQPHCLRDERGKYYSITFACPASSYTYNTYTPAPSYASLPSYNYGNQNIPSSSYPYPTSYNPYSLYSAYNTYYAPSLGSSYASYSQYPSYGYVDASAIHSYYSPVQYPTYNGCSISECDWRSGPRYCKDGSQQLPRCTRFSDGVCRSNTPTCDDSTPLGISQSAYNRLYPASGSQNMTSYQNCHFECSQRVNGYSPSCSWICPTRSAAWR